MILLIPRIADDKDLIYEGIATCPNIHGWIIWSGFRIDDKDLIYEGIATLKHNH